VHPSLNGVALSPSTLCGSANGTEVELEWVFLAGPALAMQYPQLGASRQARFSKTSATEQGGLTNPPHRPIYAELALAFFNN